MEDIQAEAEAEAVQRAEELHRQELMEVRRRMLVQQVVNMRPVSMGSSKGEVVSPTVVKSVTSVPEGPGRGVLKDPNLRPQLRNVQSAPAVRTIRVEDLSDKQEQKQVEKNGLFSWIGKQFGRRGSVKADNINAAKEEPKEEPKTGEKTPVAEESDRMDGADDGKFLVLY